MWRMPQINQESSDRAGGHSWKVRHKMFRYFRYFVQKRGAQWAHCAVVLRLLFSANRNHTAITGQGLQRCVYAE